MRKMRLDPATLAVSTFEAPTVAVATRSFTGMLETCWNSCVWYCDSSVCQPG